MLHQTRVFLSLALVLLNPHVPPRCRPTRSGLCPVATTLVLGATKAGVASVLHQENHPPITR